MERLKDTWVKGELVPGPGTYRCTGSGEIWVNTEDHVRFPPCDVCKDGSCRWQSVREPRGA
jgi:hypothetical protein